ncbi:MAG: phosphoribosylformylglycinamidine synthase subunit PurQ, partial [Bdellovibrionales bacterium]|nr:phosphoribosylformylglycinamidine synthase subunit PurQ [Bdellovibrionales bacterium]
MRTKPKFLVLCGDGINCERETANALSMAGAATRTIHINQLTERATLLDDVQGLALPGGFSFGDELGSGQILALKLRHSLHDQLLELIAKKRAVIGICNGFQVLVRLNILPGPAGDRFLTLTHNRQNKFLDRWVNLEVEQSSCCLWTQGITSPFKLPVRHGEGRVVVAPGSEERWQQLVTKGQIALRYSSDINGSYQQVAGICDPSGMVLGLMPHPEVAIHPQTVSGTTDHQQWGAGF